MESIIKTEEENRVALIVVERLMAGDPDKDSERGKLLKLLVGEIQLFERRYDIVPSPIEYLEPSTPPQE